MPMNSFILYSIVSAGVIALASGEKIREAAASTGDCGLTLTSNVNNTATLNQTTVTCYPQPSPTFPVCQLPTWQDLSPESKTQCIQIGWNKDEWNEHLRVTSLHDLEEVFWNDICQEYQDILTNQGYNETSWNMRLHKAAGAYCQVVAWNELSSESRNDYQDEGWSAQTWNAKRWIHSRKEAEEISWNDLCHPYLQELEARGWNQVAWDEDNIEKMTFYNEAELDWEDLPEDRRLDYSNDGVGRREYQRRYTNMEDGSHNDILAPAGEFFPQVIPLQVPQVQALNFTYLSSLDIEIGLVESVPDREAESLIASAPLREYIARIQQGEASTYSQVEDDQYIQQLWNPIGSKVIKYLRSAISTSDLAKNGQYKQEWKDMEDSMFDWAMFLGGKGTVTAMHFDTDSFNFLYVVEGRKRVVMLENTGLVNETRFNVSSFFHGSAWTDLNILKPENQPPGTVNFEVGPGEGVTIPRRAWHSVENIEHTLAYSFRLL